MRTSIRRRVLSLLLTLAMVLTLTPAAQLAEGDGGEQNPPPTVDTDPPDTTPDPPETTPDPPVTETITIVLYNGINSVTSDTGLTMNERSEERRVGKECRY